MATFMKAVLPSGRGICLEKLSTRQYRAVSDRVASKLGDAASSAQMTSRLSHEMLLASFRAITKDVIPVKMTEATGELPADVDVDAMLDGVAEADWVRPTFEQLVTEGPLSLETLLDEPADYLVATQVVASETLGAVSTLRGKVKREFAER